MVSIQRAIRLENTLKKKSVLLLGPRRTGKSFYLTKQLPLETVQYNLLHSDVFRRLSARPSLIRESIREYKGKCIVIDEIQKLPMLMDEVHTMIEEYDQRFVLTGSSLRKLKKNYTSLMAGRAKTIQLYPFLYHELKEKFQLQKALEVGTLPPIYLSETPHDELSSYVGDYLKEEIQAEALIRNIYNFSRFLEVAAKTNGQLVNFEAVASDAQVPSRTVREYFSLLEDTLMGEMLRPFQSKQSRKTVAHGKFYFFDTGVVNNLIKRKSIQPQTREFGESFEHFIFLEIRAWKSYTGYDEPLSFWRTHTGVEVDFLIGEKYALEVKSSTLVSDRDLKNIRSFAKEFEQFKCFVVSQDPVVRKIGEITIVPWSIFLECMWQNTLSDL